LRITAASSAAAVGRHEVDQAVDVPKNARQHAADEPRGAARDLVEHRLQIGRRAADHSQDFARRGLLLERLDEIGIARLELVEKPHVLDRDDRLIREGLEESDLLVSEGRTSGLRIKMTPVTTPSRTSATASIVRYRCAGVSGYSLCESVERMS